jgi:ParB family transcriptional regulator, chromosome partitioning protein
MAKANKRQALGRGLSALLDDSASLSPSSESFVGNVVELTLDQIEVNPFQPRTNFNQEAIEDLAKSIQALGVIQPITVRKTESGTFQLVSGERRLRAAKSVGLSTIPSFVRTADDQESLEMALVENIQREDLDPIEVALSYQRLINEIELTQEELSERVGKKRSTITNYLRLLRLDPIIQTGMRDAFISMGHGRALISLEDRSTQLSIYEQILAKGLSVRATEKLVKADPATRPKKILASSPYIEKKLKFYQKLFGDKARIQLNASGGGQIVIPFTSEKDFKSLTKRLKSEP